MFVGFKQCHLLAPLLHLDIDFRWPIGCSTTDFQSVESNGRRTGSPSYSHSREPVPKRSQVSCIELLLGGYSSDRSIAAAGELVAVPQGRREVRRQWRLTVGTCVTGVKAANRIEYLFRPGRPIGR